VREWVPGLFGKASAWRWAVQRTSNAYVFNDPSSEFKMWTGTPAQDSNEERIARNVPGRVDTVAGSRGIERALSCADLRLARQ
jgi:hypothetical protein